MKVKHHRQCRNNGGSNAQHNIAWVQESHHRAWHLLFSNFQPHRIAEVINELWLDPRFKFVVVPKHSQEQSEFKLET